ncbi:MAG: polysaccharide biosynthesis/export family protein [Planctomycetes bacterium]|nr:polysaccharide biosynthesis/export family protein [Planctomycetota bacterium]
MKPFGRARLNTAFFIALAVLLIGCEGRARRPRRPGSTPPAPPTAAPPPAPDAARVPVPRVGPASDFPEGRSPEVETHRLALERARIENALGLPAGALLKQWNTEFRLGIGDQMDISVFGYQQLTGSVSVMPDGTIAPPGLEAVPADGRTREEIEAALRAGYERIGVRNPRFSVSIKSVAQRFVTVVGGGERSSRIQLQGQGTLLETLAQAGWTPGKSTSPRVTLFRMGRQVTLDLKDLVSLRDVNLNLRLKADDVLILADGISPLRISGSVGRAGDLAIPERGYLTAREMLMAVDGVQSGADLTRVLVVHKDGVEETLNLNSALFGSEPLGLKFRAGDLVYIPEAQDTAVYVFGMVRNAGLITAKAPLTYSQALALAEPERFGAVLSSTKLVRGYPDAPEVRTVSADSLLAGGDMTQDPVLQTGDVIYVPESLTSDVVDLVTKLLTPLTTTAQTGINAENAVRLNEKNLRSSK